MSDFGESKSKIRILKQRLQTLDTAHCQQKSSKYYTLQNKLISLDDRVRKNDAIDDGKFKIQLKRLEEQLYEQKQTFDIGSQKLTAFISLIQKNISLEYANQLNNNKQNFTDLSNLVMEKIRSVKNQNQKQHHHISSACENRANQIQNRIAQIKEVIQNQKRVRDQTTQFLIRTFGQEILKLQQELNQQKLIRSKCHNETMSIIEQIQENFREQLFQQKQQREKCEIIFTKLLEEACLKIESSILS